MVTSYPFIVMWYACIITVLSDWNAAAGEDIAIDDLKFVACNPNAAPPAINCTFDDGTCGWIQDPYDKFDWQRNNGSTASRRTGPTNDHTYGDASGMSISH